MAKKLSKLTAPLGIERDYQKRVRKIVTRVKEIIDENIVQNLPALVAEADALRPKTDSIRMDQDISQKISDLFTATNNQIDSEITDFNIETVTQSTANQVNGWNKEQITRVLKQGLGTDVFIGEPWLADELRSFNVNNVALIKSNNAAFLSQTENIVFDGIRRGLRHEQIAKQILGTSKDELGKVSRFKNAKSRANLIARDQVNKLNGQLTKLRQESVGVTHYIWRDVNDSRVRSSHRARDGKTYSWAKGSELGTHPGDEIQCRCYAEPVLTDLLK